MPLDITGKLFKILPEQTGSGKNGNWIKQDFIIETAEQFPKKLCIAAWGDKSDILKKLNVGDELKVAFNLESREYNDKWYTDIKAWKIDVVSGQKKESTHAEDSLNDLDQIFGEAGDDEPPF